MAKIKTMKWHNETVEFGWGESNTVARGIKYKYTVSGSSDNYAVAASPIIDDMRLNDVVEKGFSTVEDAKYWAHEHHCKQIEQWLE